jgi:hypothetical protein
LDAHALQFEQIAMMAGSAPTGLELGDLWVYDTITNVWTQIPASSPPPNLSGVRAVYVAEINFLVAFGGLGMFPATIGVQLGV